jgi:hypothetical protein
MIAHGFRQKLSFGPGVEDGGGDAEGKSPKFAAANNARNRLTGKPSCGKASETLRLLCTKRKAGLQDGLFVRKPAGIGRQ